MLPRQQGILVAMDFDEELTVAGGSTDLCAMMAALSSPRTVCSMSIRCNSLHQSLYFAEATDDARIGIPLALTEGETLDDVLDDLFAPSQSNTIPLSQRPLPASFFTPPNPKRTPASRTSTNTSAKSSVRQVGRMLDILPENWAHAVTADGLPYYAKYVTIITLKLTIAVSRHM